MILNFKEYSLFENPNYLKYNGKEYGYLVKNSSDDKIPQFEKTSIPFAYITGDEYPEIEKPHLEIGTWGGRHEHILNYKYLISKYDGRLWKDIKIISFWEYPENQEKLKEIVEELENLLNIKIWNNDYKIEIVNKDESEFIPLERYKKDHFKSIERELHLLPFELKNQYLKKYKNYSSKYRQRKKPLNYRMKLYSENFKQKPFF